MNVILKRGNQLPGVQSARHHERRHKVLGLDQSYSSPLLRALRRQVTSR